MSVRAFASDRLRDIGAAGKWFLLVVPMAAVVGTLCAAFLWSLDRVTEIRLDHPVLLFGLPVAGVAIGLLYHWMGRAAEGGNNLIVDQIHEPGGGVPLRMAPLILIATVTSHLFGASVGREGTAVQVGGSIAGGAARLLGLSPQDVRIILMTGIAAGFGAVFGTPIAGAVFALEVLAVGRIEYEALVPAVLAAVVGNWACQLWGVHHVAYHVTFAPRGVIEVGSFAIDLLLLAKVTAAGVAFGLAGLLFSELSHSFGALFRKICPIPYLRPAIGGILTIGLVYAIGTRAYLGLGVTSPDIGDPSIVAFFGGQHFAWAWAWKILFTVLAISTGFKGGEVTPLFFIGAALGNAIAGMVGAPVDLFAALGFVAIFAAASNTPLACTIMGIELFGGANTVYIAVACFVAYLCSGHSGIYLSQRIGVPKTTTGILPPDIPLRQAREIGYAALERMVVAFPTPKRHSPTNLKKEQVESPMSYPHHVIADEIGMVRVYMKPKDKYRKTGSGKLRSAFSSRPLYQELVRQAKAAGLINAVAHHTHYGFSNHGDIGSIEPESINPSLTMCVELVGPKQMLETFCRRHGDLLQGKVIVYKHVERWRIGAHPAEVKAMLHTAANGEAEDKVAVID